MIHMQYEELLKSSAWSKRRLAILARDSYECQNCHNANIKERSVKGDVVILKREKLINQDHNSRYTIKVKSGDKPPVDFKFYANALLSHDLLKRYVSYYEFVQKEKCQPVLNLFEEKIGDSIETHYVRGLHVHHKYYQEELLPWEYPDHALTTLCFFCHEKLHANQKIEWLDKSGVEIGKMTCCKRCGGSGYFPEYIHIELGVCFRCRGAKYEELINHQ